jgi:hypothetical protein
VATTAGEGEGAPEEQAKGANLSGEHASSGTRRPEDKSCKCDARGLSSGARRPPNRMRRRRTREMRSCRLAAVVRPPSPPASRLAVKLDSATTTTKDRVGRPRAVAFRTDLGQDLGGAHVCGSPPESAAGRAAARPLTQPAGRRAAGPIDQVAGAESICEVSATPAASHSCCHLYLFIC